MSAQPTRISELSLTSPLDPDQIPIARGSGAGGQTLKVTVGDLLGEIRSNTNSISSTVGAFNVSDSPTVDLTWNSTTRNLRAEVFDNSIDNFKLRNSTGLSVIGRSLSSTGDPSDINGTANQVLRVNNAGNNLDFGQINLSSSNAVVNTLPIINGGTGQTTANAAFNALAPSQSGNSGNFLITDGTNT